MAFTREQVESIQVGDKLRYLSGQPTEILEITCKREDVAGKLFVHGYRRFSENGRISFSIKEGNELDFKLYQLVR